MQRIICSIPKNCEVVFTSCTHIGSWLCHYDGIVQMVNYVKANKNRRLFHLGDIIESITTDDKRYQADGIKEPIPLKQIAEAIKIFDPIKNQILGVLGGNHELKLHRFGNLAELFATTLKVPYGTRTARLIFKNDKRVIFKGLITHDVPMFKSKAKDFLQRQANILAALKMSMQYRMGDTTIMICGHPHQLLVIPPSPMLYLTDGENGVKQHYLQGDLVGTSGYINPDQRWYGCAGSFRKKYVDGIDDYADIYDPIELGFLILKIANGKIESLTKKVV